MLEPTFFFVDFCVLKARTKENYSKFCKYPRLSAAKLGWYDLFYLEIQARRNCFLLVDENEF